MSKEYEESIIKVFRNAGFQVQPEDTGCSFSVSSEDKPNLDGIQAGLVVSPSSCNLVSRSIAISFDSVKHGVGESVSLFKRGEFVGKLFL